MTIDDSALYQEITHRIVAAADPVQVMLWR